MKEIAIVGAGIGGLTAAHSLQGAGLKVRVFERAEQLRASGAGITLQANAMAALDSLGLAKKIASEGYSIREGRLTNWKGKVLSEVDVGAISEVAGHIGVGIHRARLVELLAEGLEDVLEFGVAVDAVQTEKGRVVVVDALGEEREFDGLVGCDGLHSAVRRSVLGDSPLRYAGYTTWRGIARMNAHEVKFTELWGPGRRFGLVPISDGEVYWFAVENRRAGCEPKGAVLEELKELFQGWPKDVEIALAKTEEEDVIWTDCFDRTPTKVWGRGTVTLLGDAIHPMTPNLGQGGGQAVESAVVLGRCLQKGGELEEVFRRYEELRRARCKKFTTTSWRVGRLGQWRNGLARGVRDLGMQMTSTSTARTVLAELYDFEGWYQRAGGC